MDILQLKVKQRAFNMAVSLTSAMEAYEMEDNEINLNQLKTLAKISNGMPLPTGRWGNAIALAMETGNFLSAEQLINNADEIGLETTTVSSELGWQNEYSLEDEFFLSLFIFDLETKKETLVEIGDNSIYDYVKVKINNSFSAIDRIKNKLNISEEKMHLLGKK